MWKEILTTYWSQVTLLLLAIGYLIKRIFDDRSKKAEINHSVYQQNRISALTNFFRNYAAVELMWKQIHIWAIVQNKLSAEEIDKYIWPSINSLKTSVIELKLYFEKNDHDLFELILENILDINQEMSLIFFQPNLDQTLVQRTNKFIFYRDDMFQKNNKILTDVTDKIRKLFSN
ncbi:hypothetical protein LK994_04715 [Ferruginibacter lapsinanis]|uniref:hypothetical protein n=1 Tax=Ferruginibacter lapsinanis TaxID=563172 RepID=UPI001E325C3E|nr:hypothetical protein [Ferruginibacter lapsinanis]UEG50775.1 hypothetical protein LK994_04715 [Ferruginibacter lapsinanis]